MCNQSAGSWRGPAAAALWVFWLAGCQVTPPRPAPVGSVVSAGSEGEAPLQAHQLADVQVALGRALEKRGEPAQAQAAYLTP